MGFSERVSSRLNDGRQRPRRPRTTGSERREWIQRYLQSGQSQRAFADKHDLGLSTLRNWIQRESESDSPLRLLEVPVIPTQQASDLIEAEIVLREGHRIRLRGAAVHHLFGVLMKVLR